MEKTTRNYILAVGGALLFACFCLSLVGVAVFNVWEVTKVNPETSQPVANLSPGTGEPVPTLPSLERSTSVPPRSTGVPAESSQETEEIQEIQTQVVALRGLNPTGDVDLTLFSPAQMREHVITDFLGEYTSEEARNDAVILAAFGLLETDFDLYDFYVDLYSEQVAGFYDYETKEMYVIQGEGFQGPERLTYAHEYAHALQDQVYDMQSGLNYNEKSCETEVEHCMAVRALFEGDATLLEVAWYQTYATRQDREEIQAFYQVYQGTVFNQAPAFMQQDFFFPYEAGYAFVNNLFNRGGWEAVDQTYRNLPVSTEQIMHPERYPNDAPIPISLPDLLTILGDGWKELERNVRGEWTTYLILAYGLDPSARLPEERARQAAEGWGGDEYGVYYNPETQQTVMIMQTVWESSQEASEFGEAFREFTSKRFSAIHTASGGEHTWEHGEGHTEFHLEGEKTTWILAPNAALGKVIWEHINQSP
ncbi:MAG TPA: hypothetical protein VJ436_07840 [Anaerolineales bacterium]|nr:hypothetical protein [Anaerolineales bacterium]